MKRRVLVVVVTIGLAACVHAQEPVITSFESDGTLTWSNASPDAIASIERLTDIPVTVTETLGVSDGSRVVYSYTVEHPPIVNPSVTISDGTYSWNDVTLSSSPATFYGAVSSYERGQVSAGYLAGPPMAGTTIQVEYAYLPVNATREWLVVHSERATSAVAQATVNLIEDNGLFRCRNHTAPLSGMAFIPAGTFLMGSPPGEPGRYSDETQHWVTLTRDFFLQETEVTNRQMADVLNWARSQHRVSITHATVQNLEGAQQELLDLDNAYGGQIAWNGSQLMVDAGKESYPCLAVTWHGAQAYCNYLSDLQGLNQAIRFSDWSMDLDANGYRLPTEAEWEYACRAGTRTAFYTGDSTYTGDPGDLDPNLDVAGWYRLNSTNPDNPMYSGKGTHPVGQKLPNGWGLFDMHGNAGEWCWDWYGTYPGTVTDPTGPTSGAHRVSRGGGWGSGAKTCRSAHRDENRPIFSDGGLGFRPGRSSVP